MNAKLFLVALLALGFSACDETSKLQEVELQVPAEETAGFPRVPVKLDTSLNLKVLFRPTNGCGRFSRADSINSRLLTEIRIFAAYPSEEMDAICTDQSKLIAFPFRFRPTAVGKHYFKFWQSDGKFLLDSVVVR